MVRVFLLSLCLTAILGSKVIPKEDIKPRKRLYSVEEVNNFIDSESVTVIGGFECVEGKIDKRDGMYLEFMDAVDNHMDVPVGITCDRRAIQSLDLEYIPGVVVTRKYGESLFPLESEVFVNPTGLNVLSDHISNVKVAASKDGSREL